MLSRMEPLVPYGPVITLLPDTGLSKLTKSEQKPFKDKNRGLLILGYNVWPKKGGNGICNKFHSTGSGNALWLCKMYFLEF